MNYKTLEQLNVKPEFKSYLVTFRHRTPLAGGVCSRGQQYAFSTIVSRPPIIGTTSWCVCDRIIDRVAVEEIT